MENLQVKAVDCETATGRLGEIIYFQEASSLGLPPGEFPETVTVDTEGTFHFHHDEYFNGNLSALVYHKQFTLLVFKILND